MMLRAYLAFGTSLAALSAAAVPALAQDADPPADTVLNEGAGVRNAPLAPAEIVVTARRFEERLQEVPIAVTAITTENIERQNLQTLNDFAEKTAGFAFEDFSGSVQQPSIRGQVNLRTTSPVQNVATYIDGIYLQRGYLIDQSITELERVEIIKGPQSALYGRNAFAGVVNLQTRTPDLDEFQGQVTGGIGSDELYEASAWVSVPVIPDKLAILGAIAHSQFDGTWENNHPLATEEGAITEGNVGGFNKEAYQVRVLARPIDEVELDLLYIHTDRFVEAPANYVASTAGLTSPVNTLNCSPVAGAFGPPENRLFCGELPVEPILSGAGDTRPPGIIVDPRAFGRAGPADIVSANLTLNPGGPISIEYQLGYVEGSQEVRGNTTRNPLEDVILPPFFAPLVPDLNLGVIFDSSGTDSSFEAWSHDWRVNYESDRVRLFAGVNYNDVSDIESNASVAGPALSLDIPTLEQRLFPVGPGLPFGTFLLQRRTFLLFEEDIWGLYGFFEYEATDAFTVTLEGRYTIEDRTATDFLTREPTNPALQAFNPPVQNATFEFFAPRATITYQPDFNHLIFASAGRGVKSGGFNGFVPNLGQRTYDEETNWTYEIGSKNTFDELGLTLNGSVFYTDWRDVQTNEGRLNPDGTPFISPAIVSTVTGNLGDVEIIGAEVEGFWRFLDAFTLDFGAAYNHAEYAEGQFSQRFGVSGNCDGTVCPDTPALDISGNQVERVPAFDGFVGLGYEGTWRDGEGFYLRGDVTYQTKQYVDEANLAFVGDRLLVNAQAGVTYGPFELNAWVKNLLDEEYVSSAFFLIGTAGPLSASYVPFLGQKRTFGAKLSFNF